MKATTDNFSRASLWPPNDRATVLRVPDQIDSDTGEPIGPGLIKATETGVYVIWNQKAQAFVPFDPDVPTQLFQANMRNRYGAGWEAGQSKGTRHGTELLVWWQAVNPDRPFPAKASMEYSDLVYTSAYDDLESAYKRLLRDNPDLEKDAQDARRDDPIPPITTRPPAVNPVPIPPPTVVPPRPSLPSSGRTVNVDFNCTVQKPSHSIDLPPNTTRIDGDLLLVISEDPRQSLLHHFTDPETGVSALNVGNVRVSFFALRGNNTGKSEKKPKRKLRWGFTQGAQGQARVEGDITAKDGQLGGPDLALPGVHRIRFTHLTATGATTFTFANGAKMKVISRETGQLNSAKFWLGTSLPADLGDTSYIPPIGRITGSLTINGSGSGVGTGTGAPPITPTPPTTQPQPQPVTDLIEFVRDLNARARDLSNQTQALLNMVEKS